MSRCEVTCRGEDRSFAFEPESTALLVIDMQRHFLSGPDDEADSAAVHAVQSAGADEPMEMRAIIPRVAHLVRIARHLGCMLVHTREGYSPDLGDVSGFRRELDYVGHDGPLGRTLIRGEIGHDFVAELQPLAGETVIDKASFGAFFRTGLDEHLRQNGVTHLILCGVTTQCCVHSTLREAVDLGYWCLTVADCCAASEQSLHDAALLLIAGEGHLFGWVADLADLADLARPASSGGTPASYSDA